MRYCKKCHNNTKFSAFLSIFGIQWDYDQILCKSCKKRIVDSTLGFVALAMLGLFGATTVFISDAVMEMLLGHDSFLGGLLFVVLTFYLFAFSLQYIVYRYSTSPRDNNQLNKS